VKPEHHERMNRSQRLSPQPGLESEEPDRTGRVLGPRIRAVEQRRAVLGVEVEVLIGVDSDDEMERQPAEPEECGAPEHRTESKPTLTFPGDEETRERDARTKSESDGRTRVRGIRRCLATRLHRGLGRQRHGNGREERSMWMPRRMHTGVRQHIRPAPTASVSRPASA
jgi:hypothetical protein